MKTTQNPKTAARSLDWEGVRQRIAAIQAALADSDEVAPEVLQQVWARRAAQLAQVPAPEEAGAQLELVLVRLGREVYGLDAQYVHDIRPLEHLTRVPRVPVWVAGVVNLRGRILSVLDLGRFFGLPREEENTACLVHVETPEMELALLVDDVLDVESLPASRVQEATDTIRGLRPEYMRGVAGREGGGDGLLVVLDLPALLADERLIVHEEIV